MASITAVGTCVPPGPSRKATGWPPIRRRSDGKSFLQRSDSASPKTVREAAACISSSPKSERVRRFSFAHSRCCALRLTCGQQALGRGHLGGQHGIAELAAQLRTRLRHAFDPTYAQCATDLVRPGEF